MNEAQEKPLKRRKTPTNSSWDGRAALVLEATSITTRSGGKDSYSIL